jgi:hypothetical protein
MRIAIMQPTYLPWLGYFDLIDRVDQFVLLDTVQFARRSWQSRNRIRSTKAELELLSVPTRNAGMRDQLIVDVQLVDGSFVETHLAAMRRAYAGAPFAKELLPQLEAELRKGAETMRLSVLTSGLIAWLCQKLGISTPMLSASSLPVDGKRSDLLSAIAAHLGASQYLSPAGSVGYLSEERGLFEERGLKIEVQGFEHPVYQQRHEPFLSHAAIVDALFNVGPADTLALIRAGRRPERTLDQWISEHSETAKEAS